MKTLKTILQEVISGIKAWVDTNTVHKTGDETINGVKTFPDGIVANVSVDSIAWETITDKPSSFTPVAHTHVTADVTDLLNTAHEWTKAQTYSDANAIIIKNNSVEIGNEPSAYNEQKFIFRDKNNQQIAAIKYQNQLSSTNTFNTSLVFSVTDKFKDGVRNATGTAITSVWGIGLWNDGTKYIYNDARWRNNLLPFTNNFYDLGSSSYQWNNLYAKNYYYNGVAWGLDKANLWSAAQFYSRNSIHVRNVEPGVAPSSDVSAGIRFENANASYVFADIVGKVFSSGATFVNLIASNKFTNGALDPNGTTISKNWQIGLRADGSGFIYTDCGWRNNLVPCSAESGSLNLGTSTNKWKTLNGINPGALSLPDYNNYLDVTSNIPVASLDGTQIDLNTYLADKTGWLSIVIADTAGNYITVTQGRAGGSTVFNNSRTFHTGAQSNGYISVFFPIIASMSKFAFIKASSLIQMRFYYCLGNV